MATVYYSSEQDKKDFAPSLAYNPGTKEINLTAQQNAPGQGTSADYTPIASAATAGSNWKPYTMAAYSGADPTARSDTPTLASWNTFTPSTYQGNIAGYTGLMNGDYNALESALAVGGNIAANNAYTTGSQNLVNTMSGRGTYGSSIMQQQQLKGLDREYMDAKAKNAAAAAAARYQLQQQDAFKRGEIDLATYQARIAEFTANNQIGATQNIALNNANQQNLDRGLLKDDKLNTLEMQKYIAKLNENTQLQGYGVQQNIAQNQYGADVYKTDVGADVANRGYSSQEKIATGNNNTTLANTGLLTQNAKDVQTLQNTGQLANTTQQGVNATNVQTLQNTGQLANTVQQGANAADTQRLQNQGSVAAIQLQGQNQLANTGLLTQNATDVQKLQNEGRTADITQQGLNAKVIQELQNTGMLADTQLNNTSAEGIAAANRDLQNVTAINERQSREAIAQWNNDAQKYVADQGLLASKLDNTTKLQIASITANSASNELAAKVNAAAKAGNNALVAQLLGGAGELYKQNKDGFNQILKDAWTGVGNWWDGLNKSDYASIPTSTWSAFTDASDEL